MTITVSVGCKLPHGLHIDIDKHPRITIKGMNSTIPKDGMGVLIGGITARGDFAITEGVNKEVFDEFMRRNANSAFVKNHMIFAHEKPVVLQGLIKEHAAVETGFEGMTEAKMKTKVSKKIKTLDKDE